MSKRKYHRKRNPKNSTLGTIVNLGVLAGVGYGVYKGAQYVKANPNAVQNFLSGQQTFLPNGTPNPGAAPWLTDTGYTLSNYGGTPTGT